MSLGENIRSMRKEKKLSQVAVAEKAQIAVNSLRLYEAGKRDPNLSTLLRIANALGVRMEDLLGIEEFDTGEEFKARWDELAKREPVDKLTIIGTGTPAAFLKQAWNEMNENGHEKVAEYAADILPTHRK